MSFPKPEYIQNFIDEKLKKGNKTEKTSLMDEDSLARESEEVNGNERSHHNPSLETPRRMNGSSGESPAFSESDDQARRKRVGLNGKSTGSESDFDTDDSAVLARSKLRNGHNSAPIPARHKHKKAKDARTPLRGSDTHGGAYGGTSEVELDTAETLASYSPSNGVKGILKVGGNTSKRQEKENLIGGSSPQKSRRDRKGDAGNHNGDSSTSDDPGQSYGHEVPHSSSHNHGSLQGGSDVESEHCHDSSDERSEIEQKKRNRAMRKLLIATGLSFLFMVGEVVGGYLANSLAIMTDASHLLTDVSSFLISIIALKMAARPISKKMTFGWHRAEVIGALISVLAIWVVTAVLVYLAVMRLITKDYTVNGETMLITASLAVGFNILMGLVLHEAHGHSHGHNHGHSHGDNHDHDHEAGSTTSSSDEIQSSGNVNVRAAFIHVIGDLLQSLGVLVAAFIIYFKPEYKIADPICTFLFSILVLITTITILRDTVIVIMEGSPVGIEYNVVKDKLLEIEGVTAVHDLRIWSLTLNQTVMSAHLAIDKGTDSSHVLKQATRRLKSLYDFHSLTIQVEYYSVDMDDCKKCQPA